ncbi:PAAR domain-containing protein [Erwinia billingiae]|uniref:PAAR domain-containing protein n=1 Tax=Erwinia billingiae TaxID=182337 RepID=UPI001248C64A|nr:PAAR domain-containing protein [Erwinia billingiae]QEW31484.1 PAAR domain-containing protein [Erwinia billingiae]
MANGFWIVQGDKTTCGGSVLTGHPNGKLIGPHRNRQATVGCKVSCGKHPGSYSVAGGYPGEVIHGQLAASTIYSRSTCPCKAFFIPSHTFMSHGPYPETVAEKAISEPFQETEQHAQAAKKQNNFSDTYKPEDNPLLNGVYIWTETTSAGHVFVSVHENNRIYLYTYGRYGRTDKSTFTGDGILNFFQDADARNYYRYELYQMGARAFRIDDADPKLTRNFFENLWSKGVTPIQTPNMQDGTKRRGRTVDKYDVTGSNCTTHSVKGIKFAGSKVFEHGYTSTTAQLPIDIEEDFTIPVSLQSYLQSKSADQSSMLVNEMTSAFRKQFPNIENKSPQPLGGSAKIQQAAADSAAVSGSTSPYSGGTVGGSLGSTYDDE